MSFTVDGTSGLTFPNATTQASAGGMTLLGTLTTTSGTTQTLSSLTLTNYKQLSIAVNGVGFSSADTNQALRLAGVDIMRPIIANDSSVYGIMTLDLSNGAFNGVGFQVTASNTGSFGQPGFGNLSNITTSTTSLSFTWTAGQAFTRGSIKVYGLA